MSLPLVHSVVLLPAHRLKELPANANQMPERVFQRLVEEILEEGFKENLVVAMMTEELRRLYLTPAEDDDAPWWLIIGGHHRYRAAQVLEMAELPCIVLEGLTDQQVKAQSVRLNMLKGKIDPLKLVTMFEEIAADQGEDLARDQMALLDERELKNMIREIRGGLPREMQVQLDARTDEVKTADDLTRVIAELVARAGDTLELGYATFVYGGKTCLMCEMDASLHAKIEQMKGWCYANRVKLPLLLDYLLIGLIQRADEAGLPRLSDADFSP